MGNDVLTYFLLGLASIWFLGFCLGLQVATDYHTKQLAKFLSAEQKARVKALSPDFRKEMEE